jgi:hypothetical protein
MMVEPTYKTIDHTMLLYYLSTVYVYSFLFLSKLKTLSKHACLISQELSPFPAAPHLTSTVY